MAGEKNVLHTFHRPNTGGATPIMVNDNVLLLPGVTITKTWTISFAFIFVIFMYLHIFLTENVQYYLNICTHLGQGLNF